ncbi:MAG: response regulator [Lachnospiraceae bacterium]|nr:response regulator [Lachnospiraceae bacterium]MBR6351907.1 response regulator [Bacillota bacterium]
MTKSFGEILRRLRIEKGLSQQQLADRLYVQRPSLTNWETGRRIPDVVMISRIAEALGVETSALLDAAKEPGEAPNVMLVDDEAIILDGGLPVLREALPKANIVGFTKPLEAVEYIRNHPVALAFIDIELGRASGLDLCRELLSIKPRTNVVFLTAFREYSFDAWGTGACGFLLKPLEADAVRAQLSCLRFPVEGLL